MKKFLIVVVQIRNSSLVNMIISSDDTYQFEIGEEYVFTFDVSNRSRMGIWGMGIWGKDNSTTSNNISRRKIITII